MYFFIIIIILLIIIFIYPNCKVLYYFYRYDVPGASEIFGKQQGKLAFVNWWFSIFFFKQTAGPTTIIIKDVKIAKNILSGKKQHNYVIRFGDFIGTSLLKMKNSGIIWNADSSRWKIQRMIFDKSIDKNIKFSY